MKPLLLGVFAFLSTTTSYAVEAFDIRQLAVDIACVTEGVASGSCTEARIEDTYNLKKPVGYIRWLLSHQFNSGQDLSQEDPGEVFAASFTACSQYSKPGAYHLDGYSLDSGYTFLCAEHLLKIDRFRGLSEEDVRLVRKKYRYGRNL